MGNSKDAICIEVESTTPIPVSVVSNSQLMCEGLATLLPRHIAMFLVGSYGGKADVALECPSPPGHIVLVDGSLDLSETQAWIAAWHSRDASVRLITIELAPNAESVLRCIEAGACGYTLRGATPAEIATVMRAVCQGTAYCSPEITARLFARLAERFAPATVPHRLAGLTNRELEVLRYLVDSYTNQEIAAALVVEIRTVKHHVHQILDKLRVQNRHAAAALAIECGWRSEIPR